MLLRTLFLAALASVVSGQGLVFAPQLPAQVASCFGYRGRYDGLHILHMPPVCAMEVLDSFAAAQIVPLPAGHEIVMHVRPADLDPSVFPTHNAQAILERAENSLKALSTHTAPRRVAQVALQGRSAASLLHRTPFSAFYALPLDNLLAHLETLTDEPYLELTLVSPSDLPLDRSKLDDDRLRLQTLLDHLSYQSLIDTISGAIDKKGLRSVVRHLTNEDQRAGWQTRHSFTEGAVQAAHWLKKQYEATGLDCRLHHYFVGFSPNVICAYEPLITASGKNASDLPVVVIAAHYDDRGSFGYVRAPGGDDDGSGSSMLLNIARTLGEYNVRFKDVQVILAAFSGEEQGLWGSRYFAKSLREEGRDVIMMLQADMIAYRKPGEPMQLAFPAVHSVPEGRWLVGNVSRLYTPELVTGITPACCSDSQSFDDEGFASSWVFERNGPIADPAYHNSLDTSDREGYDLEQMRLITSTVLATLLSLVPFQV